MKIVKLIFFSVIFLILCGGSCNEGASSDGGGAGGGNDTELGRVDVGINRNFKPTPINPNPGQVPPS